MPEAAFYQGVLGLKEREEARTIASQVVQLGQAGESSFLAIPGIPLPFAVAPYLPCGIWVTFRHSENNLP